VRLKNPKKGKHGIPLIGMDAGTFNSIWKRVGGPPKAKTGGDREEGLF